MKNKLDCCHNCEKRKTGCHADCMEYIEATAERAEIARNRTKKSELADYTIATYKRMRKAKKRAKQ